MMNAMAPQVVPLQFGAAPLVWDDQQHILDELLEIFTTPGALPGAPTTPASMSVSSAASLASPVSSRYGYESSSGQSRQSSPYPVNSSSSSSMNNNYSSIRKAHGQMPLGYSMPGSPSASSSDESGAYTGNGGDDNSLDDLEMDPTSGSPMSAKKKRQLEMRRKRNRESMRRVRQRKRIEYSELKKLLPGLEARLNHLRELKNKQEQQLAGGAMVQSGNRFTGTPGPGLSKAMEQLQIVEDAFRRENAWLEQEIDKYEQAFVALQDLIEELREADVKTEPPVMNDPFAWTSRAAAFLPQFYATDLSDFVRNSALEVVRQVEAAHKLQETANQILGWRTRSTVSGPWIHFAMSKDFMHEDIEVIVRKTWFVNSQSHTVDATMPRNHYMKVLRVVDESTIICARNLFFPGDETNYCVIYLLMRVKTAKGYMIAQRSLLPTDSDGMKNYLGSKFSYVNVFYAMILERYTEIDTEGNTIFLPVGCKATFGGLAGNGTEIYANTWAKDLFIAMLRWESACVGPLYRLL